MDKALEENRLMMVRSLILRQISALTAELQAKRGGVTEARRTMWAETHVIRDFDDVANLSTLLSDVTFREQQYADIRLRLTNLQRMLDSPYFGRIDFIEDGYGDTEQIYIGGNSLFDETKQQYFIYDWRAPISSMYYDCGVGRASFAAPDGAVTGEITLKRQFHIEKGALCYLFDSDLLIDDDILQIELSRTSDAKIKTIINSIQKEQNQAIRCEADNIMVFGPAGSGKTSVGLHRLAYLLYRHRGRLTSARVRIFSSNNIFSSYIAGIIPELGEEDVSTLDFNALLTTYGPEERVFLGPYEQIDFLSRTARQQTNAAPSGPESLSQRDALRRAGISMKYNPDFAAYLHEYIRQYSPAVTEDACFNHDTVCEKERILALYDDRTAIGNLASKTSRTLDYVSRRFEEYFKENRKAITTFFNDLYDENFLDGEIRSKFEEQKSIVLEDLRARLFPNAKRLYEKIVRGYTRERGLPSGLSRFTVQSLKRDRLYYEDALVLFYIDTMTGRVRKERNARHILVDEAQDMSHLQHQILLNVFEGCHFTVLADVNQALYPEINLHDKEALLALYGSRSTVVELSKSYRTTYEISRFAAQWLGTFDESRFYKRMGGEPEILQAADSAQAAAGLLAGLPADFNTVGILLADRTGAIAFHRRLTALMQTPVSLIADPNDEFRRGVMVMAVPYAKGLEFDAVIIPEYGSPVFDGPWGRKTLYLMCTRALHRLYLIEEGKADN